MSQAVTDQRSLTIAEQIEACWKQRERWQGISDALSVILAPYTTKHHPSPHGPQAGHAPEAVPDQGREQAAQERSDPFRQAVGGQAFAASARLVEAGSHH